MVASFLWATGTNGLLVSALTLTASSGAASVSKAVTFTPAGATFAGRRAPGEETSEFLASADNWSRFTSVRPGPDGALYVVDMYRLVIEHPTWIPAAWQQVLGDLRAGDQMGRIYRVVRKGGGLRPVARLDHADARALAEALASSAHAAHALDALDSAVGFAREAAEVVTWAKDADLAAEKVLLAAIRARYPEDLVRSEEEGGVLDPSRPGWFVDPIDGTSAFTEGLAHWGPTIARVEPGLGVTLGGLVLPKTREWFAFYEGVAYADGERLPPLGRGDMAGGGGDELPKYGA